MWVEAVKKAGTTDPDKVIDAIIGIKVPNLTGGISEMLANHHITKPVLIGEIEAQRPVRRRVEDSGPGPGRRLVADPRQLQEPEGRLDEAHELRKLRHRRQQVHRQDGGQVGSTSQNSQDGATFQSPRFHLRVKSQHMFLLRPFAVLLSVLASLALAGTASRPTSLPSSAISPPAVSASARRRSPRWRPRARSAPRRSSRPWRPASSMSAPPTSSWSSARPTATSWR